MKYLLSLLLFATCYLTSVSSIANTQLAIKDYLNAGEQYQLANDYTQALEQYTKAIELGASSDDVHSLVEAYLSRSYLVYLLTNNRNEYCPDRKKATEIALTRGSDKIKLAAFNQYLFCFTEKDDFVEGQYLIKQVMNIALNGEIDDSMELAIFYNAVGSFYSSHKLYKSSYDFLTKSYGIWLQRRAIQGQLDLLHFMITVTIQLRDWELVELHLQQMLALSKNYWQGTDFQFFYWFNKGRSEYAQANYQDAVESFIQAIELKTTTQEHYFVANSFYLLALSYSKLGLIAEMKSTIAQFPEIEGVEFTQEQQDRIDIALYLGEQNPKLLNRYNQLVKSIADNGFYTSTALTSDVYSNQFKQLIDLEEELQEIKSQSDDIQNKVKLAIILVVLLVMVIIVSSFYGLHQSRLRFKHKSQTDYLTGIPNRRYLMEKASLLWKELDKKYLECSVLLIDIDNFKKINDGLGHDVGDIVLKHLCNTCVKILPKTAIFGRFGGEEFLMLLPTYTSLQAKAVSEQIIKTIEHTSIEGLQISPKITVSIGQSTNKCEETNLETGIKRADLALLKAKSLGKNQLHIYKVSKNQTLSNVVN
ncbi:GGDEF domain-containing protein [Paraferrimonas sp. SM1919]|uniref:GGDEF domain-containing protein n=1 Tax=Paraferrimonas sp. SM1919 TaxID=2662263 RepID=UPI0013D22EB3|nr:GGDEF domain-containing protein [Paraferrimonas sp. SM1919]